MQAERVYRYFLAGLVLATLVIKFWMNATGGKYPNLGVTTLEFVSFFTHLSTIFVGLAMVFACVGSGRWSEFFERPAVRAALALYILVVAVVYHLLLAATDENVGFEVVINALLHTVIPMLYIADWLVFARKRPISYWDIPYWLIFPAVYGVFTIIKGTITGGYPYSFLNMTELGLGGVTVNMIGFLVLFSFGAAVFITLNKVLPSR